MLGRQVKRDASEADRTSWSWTQFAFGVVVGGGPSFLALNVMMLRLPAHLTKVAVVALLCGLAAGRFGDIAWRWIIYILSN